MKDILGVLFGISISLMIISFVLVYGGQGLENVIKVMSFLLAMVSCIFFLIGFVKLAKGDSYSIARGKSTIFTSFFGILLSIVGIIFTIFI